MGTKPITPKVEKPFQLIPMEIPSTTRTSKYTEVVQTFLSMDKDSVVVKLEGTKNSSIQLGLKKVIPSFDGVEVLTKNKEVYLRRITK
jgi:hypothetical protein